MDNQTNPERKKEKKSKNSILFMLEGMGLLLAIAFLFLTNKITNLQKVKIDSNQVVINQKEEEQEPKTEAETVSQEIVIDDKTVSYRNIALFGVDSREEQLSNGTRTDTIIVASINEKTGEVKLISIYRDSYLNIGNDTYNKANAAYAYGGPEQAINMLNMNLDLDITDYLTVGFRGLIDTIDAIGGVEITVEENEIEHLNNYQICMAEEMSQSYKPVTKAGRQTLNGMQATAYCRIRYTAGSDFKRTERQRDVITEIIEKSKTLPVGDLNKLLDSILPKISTSLDVNEIITILSSIANYTVTDSNGFPFDLQCGTIGKKGSCVVPETLEANVIQLHKVLFDEDNYQPSEAVKKYSEVVYGDTSPYL